VLKTKVSHAKISPQVILKIAFKKFTPKSALKLVVLN